MDESKILKVTHAANPIIIGDIRIPCAVLEDKTRVLSEHGVTTAMKSRSGAAKRLKREVSETGRAPLPVFMAAKNLIPFISDELRYGLTHPIKYKIGEKSIRTGFDATLLPEICNVWLRARENGKLNKQQAGKCHQAEIIIRGLAHVGIIALVDEATGYQEEREKDELQKILSYYISDHLMPWTRQFPMEFFKEMFRLWGWPFDPIEYKKTGPRGPRYAGKLVRQLVYEQLPPGVLVELEMKSPPNGKWQRKNKLFQWLSEDIDNRHLEKQVAAVTALFKASSNKRKFISSFNRVYKMSQNNKKCLMKI